MVKILVVEDDKALNNSVCSYLNMYGFCTKSAFDGVDGLEKLEVFNPDIILTDIMMPRMDGFDFVNEVKLNNKNIPILIITAKNDKISKRKGFVDGADDYIVKPFDLDELVLRIEAILRRANIKKTKRIEVGNFIMDEEEYCAYIDGVECTLSVKEFNILFKLLSNPKKTITRQRLMEEFWDYDSQTSTRTVDVYMAKIRDKVSKCTGFTIQTVHGLGYRVVLDEK